MGVSAHNSGGDTGVLVFDGGVILLKFQVLHFFKELDEIDFLSYVSETWVLVLGWFVTNQQSFLNIFQEAVCLLEWVLGVAKNIQQVS